MLLERQETFGTHRCPTIRAHKNIQHAALLRITHTHTMMTRTTADPDSHHRQVVSTRNENIHISVVNY